MIEESRLASLPLFEKATPVALSALARCGDVARYATDGVIFLAGSAPRRWYVILDGTVRVVRGEEGRQHVIHTERRGGTLAEVPLFTSGPHPATAIAAEPTQCAVFERAGLERAIVQAPEIAFLMARRLAERVESLVNRLHERSMTSVQARLGQFLLARQGAAQSPTISLGMTQQQLAEELGTVRAVVARELGSLVSRGLIENLGRGRYRVLRVEDLRSG